MIPSPALSTPRWVRVIGFLSLIVAGLWAFGGNWLFHEVGLIGLERNVAQILAAGVEQQNAAAGRSIGGPRGNAASGQPVSPLGVLTWQRPLPPRPSGPRVPVSLNGSTPIAPADETPRGAPGQAELQQGVIAEATRHVWALLTAMFCGVIVAGGLGMLAAGPRRRWLWGSLRLLLCVVGAASLLLLGVLFGTVVGTRPQVSGDMLPRLVEQPAQAWTLIGPSVSDAVVQMTQSRHEWIGFLLVLLVALGWASGRTMRRGASARGSMSLMIAVIFIGTMATLAGVAVLIQYAHYPPLPPWFYAVISLVQSSWMWVLLWALLWLPRTLPGGDPGASGDSAEARMRRTVAARLPGAAGGPPLAQRSANGSENAPRVIYAPSSDGDSSPVV